MFRCEECDIDFDNRQSFNNHMRIHTPENINLKSNIIDDYVNNNLTYKQLRDKHNVSYGTLSRFLKGIEVDAGDRMRSRGTTFKGHSEETKKNLSEIRKKWLKDNPELHVWKNSDKFLSKPCEYLKSILNDNNITFVPEFTIGDRYYSIDIAFPDKKVGIEVNGNQHYNSDGTLKTYYDERNSFFIKNGWKIYQIHYTKVYNKEFVDDLVDKLINEYNLSDIDY